MDEKCDEFGYTETIFLYIDKFQHVEQIDKLEFFKQMDFCLYERGNSLKKLFFQKKLDLTLGETLIFRSGGKRL